MRGLKLMELPPGLDTGEVSCMQMKGKRSVVEDADGFVLIS